MMAVTDLEDFKSAGSDEFFQFTVGQFFVSGSFWLGIERLATVADWTHDILFWICVIAFIAGAVVSFFGYRQLSRRQKRIDRILDAARKAQG